MPSSGGKERRRTRRGSRKAWSETLPEREREKDRDGGERGREENAMNGEKPGRQAVKGEATEVSGGKWRAAVPTTPLPSLNADHGSRLPPAVPPARSLLTAQALRNGSEGLLVPGPPRVRRHQGSLFKGGMLRTTLRTGGSSDTMTSCPQMDCSHLWLPNIGSPKTSGAPSPLKTTRRPLLGTDEKNNPVQNRPEQTWSTYPHPSAGQHDKHPLRQDPCRERGQRGLQS